MNLEELNNLAFVSANIAKLYGLCYLGINLKLSG